MPATPTTRRSAAAHRHGGDGPRTLPLSTGLSHYDVGQRLHCEPSGRRTLRHGLHDGDGMKTAWRWLPALLALLVSLPISAQTVLELAPATANGSLSPHWAYRHAATSSDRDEDAWRHVDTGGFAALPDGKDAFGFQGGAFWFHATILNRNAGEQRWLLVQEYPLSDRLDI